MIRTLLLCLLLASCAVPRRSALPGTRSALRPEDASVLASAERVLDLIEADSLAEAESALASIPRAHPAGAVLRELLSRRLLGAAPPSPPRVAAAVIEEARPDEATLARARKVFEVEGLDALIAELDEPDDAGGGVQRAAAVLKTLGLEIYGRGEIDAAIVVWEKAEETYGSDAELRAFLRRARSVHSE